MPSRPERSFIKEYDRYEIFKTRKWILKAYLLHYETVADLLSECVSYMNEHFLSYMKKDSSAFAIKLRTCSLEELYLITPEYLTPYLNYVKENRRLFCTALKNAEALRLEDSYNELFRHIITPILERYGVAVNDRPYILAFYIKGLMAIISEWIKNDCADSVDYIAEVIQRCAKGRMEK